MKNIITTLLIISFFGVATLNACASKNSSSPPSSQNINRFEPDEAWNKLDGRFKIAYSKAISKNDEHLPFDCMLKTKVKPTAKTKKMLLDAGFMYRSIIGNILTGSVEVKDVPAVAKLKCVSAMELAVPVSLKK